MQKKFEAPLCNSGTQIKSKLAADIFFFYFNHSRALMLWSVFMYSGLSVETACVSIVFSHYARTNVLTCARARVCVCTARGRRTGQLIGSKQSLVFH